MFLDSHVIRNINELFMFLESKKKELLEEYVSTIKAVEIENLTVDKLIPSFFDEDIKEIEGIDGKKFIVSILNDFLTQAIGQILFETKRFNSFSEIKYFISIFDGFRDFILNDKKTDFLHFKDEFNCFLNIYGLKDNK